MRNEARSHEMPDYRTGCAADGSEDQRCECEFRDAMAANNAVDRRDNDGAGGSCEDAQRRTITAFDDFAGNETDQQTDDDPTSDDDEWHGLLQKK